MVGDGTEQAGDGLEPWEEDALDVLRRRWGEAYEIEASGGQWRARRRGGLGGWIEAEGPDGLGWAIAEDHAVKPVPLDAGEITPEMLAAAFPPWRKPVQAGSAWITMRSGTLEHWGPESLRRVSLSALTLGGLAEQLEVQAYLDRLDPDELAAVWRQGQIADEAAARP